MKLHITIMRKQVEAVYYFVLESDDGWLFPVETNQPGLYMRVRELLPAVQQVWDDAHNAWVHANASSDPEVIEPDDYAGWADIVLEIPNDHSVGALITQFRNYSSSTVALPPGFTRSQVSIEQRLGHIAVQLALNPPEL